MLCHLGVQTNVTKVTHAKDLFMLVCGLTGMTAMHRFVPQIVEHTLRSLQASCVEKSRSSQLDYICSIQLF